MVFLSGGEIKDIYDVIYPYYIVSKVLGFAAFPLRIQKTKYLFFKHFILNLIYILFIGSTILGAMDYFKEKQDEYFTHDNSQVSNVTRFMLLLMISVNYFVGLGMNFILQRPIQNLIAKIAQNDGHMKKIGISINHQKHRKVTIIYWIEALIHGLIVISLTETTLRRNGIDPSDYERFVTYTSTTITCTTYLGQMLLTLLGIFSRFRLLNKYLIEKFMEDKKSTEIIFVASKAENQTKDFNANDPAELIKKISTIHDQLNGIVCQMNLCFSFQIMVYMISWIIYSIHGTYESYRLIYLHLPGYEFLAFIDIMWIIYYTVYIAAIVVMSSLVKREGQQTATFVHQAINIQQQPQVIEKVSLKKIIEMIF
uniref:Gustatory receptor n=1 Tax=Lutzomyia longipalpis TaxID=7200 RepID=A0A7G3AL89_LUTLO